MLDLAAVFALSQACAPGVAAETLTAIAYVESRFDPLAIGVNRGPRPMRAARDASEAVRVARSLIARGANLDLGIAQINSDNLGWLGLTLEAAFDPCLNLEAAGQVLRAGYQPRAGDTPQRTLRVALSRYNTGHPARGFRNGYVGRVEAAAARLALTPTAPRLNVALSASPSHKTAQPSEPAADWDVFGRAPLATTMVFASSKTIRRTQP